MIENELESAVARVSTREDLAEFVDALRRDLAEHAEDWGSDDLEGFLDALARTVRSFERILANFGEPPPPERWAPLVARLLLAARYRE